MRAHTGFTHLEIPSALLVERGCAAIVKTQRARNAELRDAIILVPDLHAVSAIACGLRSAADVPMLLLPSITTLAAWAAGVELAQPIAARSAREVVLYQALAARPWLENADLWTMARELTGLFEEMTRHNVSLAADLDDFSVQLEAAYRARPSSALRFEAQLVHELWWAMSRESRELAPEAAYQLRLARLAREAISPLYCLGLSRITPSERAFLEGYAQQAPVAFIMAVADSSDPATAMLNAAWPRADDVDLSAPTGVYCSKRRAF